MTRRAERLRGGITAGRVALMRRRIEANDICADPRQRIERLERVAGTRVTA